MTQRSNRPNPGPSLVDQLGNAHAEIKRLRADVDEWHRRAGKLSGGLIAICEAPKTVGSSVLRESPPPNDGIVDKNGSGGGGGGDDGLGDLGLDPLLIALLKKIPTSGEWPAAQRVRWFRTFAMNVSQIYDEDSDPVEMKIDLDKEAAN